jgi:hypothetical protein
MSIEQFKTNRGFAVLEPAESSSFIQKPKEEWGVVVSLGPPYLPDYPFIARLKWLFNIHPCPYKVGDRVLLPHGKDFFIENRQLRVVGQTKVEVYESSN